MRSSTSQRVTGLIVVYLSGILIPCIASDAPGATVQIKQGALTGIAGDSVDRFLGIPYALAPTGDRRWRPPASPQDWTGIRKADRYGPVCPQVPRESYPQWLKSHFAAVGMDEDCLTLNIWTPQERRKESLPVMFYIHGGNMKFGSGSYPLYDGSILAQEGVVVVTINYRVGFLGRFAHPAMTRLQAGEPLVNYGLMDQVAALEWVRDNIHAFGGDPGNVTIFGHSAGGVSVNYLMVMPSSKGLFHKAIAQGSAISIDRERHAFERGMEGPLGPSWEEVGGDFGRHFEIDGEDRQLVAALRNLPVESILGYQNGLMITFNPSVDGDLVPDDPAKLFEQGRQHDVPYIGGANSWEWNQIDNIPLIGKWFLATGLLEGLSDQDLAIFDDQWTRIGVSQRWFAEGLFLTSTRYLAKQMSTVSSPAYLYHVTFVQENLPGDLPGAAHGVEIPFIFGHVRDHPEYQRPEVVQLTGDDLAWGDTVRGYWISFAKTGNPNGGNRPEWPEYRAESDVLIDLGNKITQQKGMYRETLDFLEHRALARREAFEDSIPAAR
jgi:para-nitrobenzyl esterase